MASGYSTANGQDLDTVFAPQHPGWPQASATEFFDVNGNDLSLRYAALSTGSAVASNTGFVLASGSDIRTQFAAYGSTNVQVLTQPSAISGSAAAGSPFGTVTSDTAACAGEKGGGAYTYTWHIANGSGFSFTAPNSATTAVTGPVSANSTLTGGIYCTISDGVSSINTNTIAVALTNTTQPYVSFTIIAETWPNNPNIGYGYANGFGSLVSVSGLPSGVTISLLEDVRTICAFALSGLSADPGQDSLSSITCNGATFSGSSASSYSYNSGTAEWQWAGSFGFVSGDQYSGTATPSSGASW